MAKINAESEIWQPLFYSLLLVNQRRYFLQIDCFSLIIQNSNRLSETTIKKLTTGFSASGLAKTDAELIGACRRGDQAAWNELVDRYQRLVFTVPRRAGLSEEQSADILQEVFLTLFEKLDEIEQPEKIRSWIVTTAKFKTWGAVRGEKKFYSPATEEEFEAEMESLVDAAPLADAVLIELEEQHLIRTALAEMEERCRKILSMIYLRDSAASYAEVAVEIGVGETSISPLRTRCLKKLAKILEK
jgi:RNA polymerase sigma factor (sigma-70 family)